MTDRPDRFPPVGPRTQLRSWPHLVLVRKAATCRATVARIADRDNSRRACEPGPVAQTATALTVAVSGPLFAIITSQLPPPMASLYAADASTGGLDPPSQPPPRTTPPAGHVATELPTSVAVPNGVIPATGPCMVVTKIEAPAPRKPRNPRGPRLPCRAFRTLGLI